MTVRGQRLFTGANSASPRPGKADEAQRDGQDFTISNRRGDAALTDVQCEVALYIESMSAELRLMAKAAKLDALAYFLEMARLEASIQIERHAVSRTIGFEKLRENTYR